MSRYIQANTSGRLHGADEPGISVLDRSFLYGDAVYEVWRTVRGVVFAFEEHFARLEASASALHLALPFDRAELLGQIRRTCAEFSRHTVAGGDLYIRLQLSRGGGPIGLDTALADRPTYVLIVQHLRGWPEEVVARGLRLSVATKLRRNPAIALDPAWKTGNYLNNLLCLREARERGADEVVVLNLSGEVTEAAVSNIVFVREGTVVTPPLSAGILAGITRRLLISEVAPSARVPVIEAAVRPEEFSSFEECALASTTKDLAPVASIDSVQFARPGDGVIARLKPAFADFMDRYADMHPELRVV